MNKQCPHCGSENGPDAKFCLKCGAPLTQVTPAGGPAYLTDNYGQKFSVTGSVIQIGSGIGRAVLLEEPDVADLHAEIRADGLDWTLWDLSNGKGIKVNNEVIQTSRTLADGDVISIGNAILRFTASKPETTPAQADKPDNSSNTTIEDLSGFRSGGETLATPPAQPTQVVMKRCSTCGQMIHQAAEICPHCGVRQIAVAVPAQPASKRSRVVAALLAIFLGAFGAHKFYLGQNGLGLLYLVFFWAYVPGIVGIVEGIYYLTMSDEQFGKKYG